MTQEEATWLVLVNQGKVCPYCQKTTEYVSSTEVYGGMDYGMIYLCRDCNAWVGVHKGTQIALGRLADQVLRECKKKAHAHFDQIWKQMMRPDIPKSVARNNAYSWLATQMNKEPRHTHIGMFDVDECLEVIEHCKNLQNNLL